MGLGAKLMSSSAGALLVALATTPLDVVKTRLQAVVAPALAARQALGLTAAAKSCVYYPICKNADAAYLRAACAHSALHTLPPPPAPSTLATMSNVVRAEGVGSLWSGMTTTLAMAVPSNMLYFTAYDELKGVLTAAAPVGSLAATFTPLVAGVAGRVVTASAMSPLELVRTKAMAAGSRINVVTLLRREVAAHGVASLWRGLSPTLWRDVPFSGVYWMGYERLKAALLARARSGADNASAPVSTATLLLAPCPAPSPPPSPRRLTSSRRGGRCRRTARRSAAPRCRAARWTRCGSLRGRRARAACLPAWARASPRWLPRAPS